MSAQPTPYDILPIPLFPFEPGLQSWLILLSAAVLGIAAAWLLPHINRFSSKELRAFKLAKRELSALARTALSSNNSKELIAQASLVLRRLLSTAGRRNVSAMSRAELKELFKNTSSQGLKDLLNLLTQMEDLKYANQDLNSAPDLLAQAQEALTQYEKEHFELKAKPIKPAA